MPNGNGKQTWSDIAHRIGIWGAVLTIGFKVFAMGSWVGAADEKFKDAATVEETQKDLLLQVNTIATKQEAMEKTLEDNKREILDAIKELQD